MGNRRWMARLLCLLLSLLFCLEWNACADTPERLPDKVLMSFYDQSLIIGDSQMRNLGNYMRKVRTDDPDFFPGVKCYGEYSLQMRRLAQKNPDSDPDAIQLTYKGRAATLTGIAMKEKPRNVFILIGLNDRIYQHTDRADGRSAPLMRQESLRAGKIRSRHRSVQHLHSALQSVRRKRMVTGCILISQGPFRKQNSCLTGSAWLILPVSLLYA